MHTLKGQHDSLFDTRTAIRNLRKVAATSVFAPDEVEWRMVRRDHLQLAVGERVPEERRLVGLTGRWREDVLRPLKAGSVEHLFRLVQILRAGLRAHVDPTRPAAHDLVECFATTDVDDVERCAHDLGEGDGTRRRFRFHAWGATRGVVL